MALNLAILLGQLNQTALQQTNPPLYQILKNLIAAINVINNISSSGVSPVGPIGPAGPAGKDGIPAFILGGDSGGGSSDDVLPGPPGINGINGTTGAQGPVGGIIIDTETIEDFIMTTIGQQGNPGPTGSQGPVGALWPLEDGLDADYIAIPGPAGRNGTDGAGALSSVLINITDAEWRTIGTANKTIVSAAGVNTILIPVYWVITVNVTTAFSGNQIIDIAWGTGSVANIPCGLAGQTVTTNSINKRLVWPGWMPAGAFSALTNQINQDLIIYGGANITGGVTHGGINMLLFYITVTVP